MVARNPVPNAVDSTASAPASSAASPVHATPKQKRTWTAFVRDVVLYLFAYILVSGVTIGPFFWQWFGSMYADGPRWIALVYSPLAYLCEVIPALRWVINQWINWWIL